MPVHPHRRRRQDQPRLVAEPAAAGVAAPAFREVRPVGQGLRLREGKVREGLRDGVEQGDEPRPLLGVDAVMAMDRGLPREVGHIRPIILVESRRVLEAVLRDIENEPLVGAVDRQRSPRNGK